MKSIKCINCKNSEAIDQIINDKDEVVYKCHVCGQISKKAISLDSRLMLKINDQSRPYHVSVGMLVFNEQNKVLISKRRFHPHDYSLLFGHVHNGETPKKAIERELIEEIGVNAKKTEFLFKDMFKTECRTGMNLHESHIFKVFLAKKEILIPDNESQELLWLDPSEIKKLKPVGKSTKEILKRINYA